MIWCSDATGQRHIPDAEGRDNSMNMCHFIHAVVPRHVETVVSLVRKTPDLYVDFKIDLDDQDMTASEAHPTYDEIKKHSYS